MAVASDEGDAPAADRSTDPACEVVGKIALVKATPAELQPCSACSKLAGSELRSSMVVHHCHPERLLAPAKKGKEKQEAVIHPKTGQPASWPATALQPFSLCDGMTADQGGRIMMEQSEKERES